VTWYDLLSSSHRLRDHLARRRVPVPGLRDDRAPDRVMLRLRASPGTPVGSANGSSPGVHRGRAGGSRAHADTGPGEGSGWTSPWWRSRDRSCSGSPSCPPTAKRIEKVGPESDEGQQLIRRVFALLRVDLLFSSRSCSRWSWSRPETTGRRDRGSGARGRLGGLSPACRPARRV